jgi:hypothetical protein
MIDIPTLDMRLEQRLERRLNFTQWILITLLLVVIAVPIIVSWWIAKNTPIISTIGIDNVQVVGETDLCPGEKLIFSYNFHAQGAGVLVRDTTAYNIDPPKTLIFSTSRRFILDGPVDQHLTEAWTIPAIFHNYETDEDEPLPPGNYRRYLSISSPSRSTVIAIISVPFSVKEECSE